MQINFHAKENMYSYTERLVDPAWEELITNCVDFSGKQGLDIGCGGGIYSKALVELGASHVTGIDFSEVMIEAAKEKNMGDERLSFKQGNANQTGLMNQSFDFILERALIHHLTDLNACFAEAYRVLKDNGQLIVQDRTPEDCLLQGSIQHIRGYLFEYFPRLIDKEIARRHSLQIVEEHLYQVGFKRVEVYTLWEKRKRYESITQLLQELKERKGKSILHELSDEELKRFIDFVSDKVKVANNNEIIEADRWTIWIARK